MPAEYEFGPFRVDVARRTLYREGEFVALTPKAAEILVLLLEEAGRVVTKEQLLERVWPGVVVEEGAIANNVSALRKALDPGFNGEAPIATVARRGYRFTVEVRRLDGTAAPMPEAAAPAAGVAAPQPAERETVLVTDIENKTGDPVFDGTIKQALMLHLAQSPYLDVLSEFKVHSLLRYMNKRGAPVVGDVALEICQRTGTKAAITGSIFAIGDDYVIGLQAVHGETGNILLSEQARARGKNEVLKALDLAAIGLRTKLGESLASVQNYFKNFDEVATSSLEALKAYTVGRREWWEHGESAAKPHQLRAIELDPHFASAYSALAIACNNMGETIEAQRYMQRAFELRDRMSEREKVRTDANYHDVVTGDLFKGLDALRAMMTSPYCDATCYTNTASSLAQVGQWDKSLAAGLKAMDMEPTAIIASNVALAQLALGLTETARGTLDDAFSRGWDPFYLHLEAYQEAFLRADEGAMKGHFDAVAGRVGEDDFLLAAAADTEAYYGRYGRARELSQRAVESARRAGGMEMAGSWAALAGFREAVVGESGRARDGALAAMEISDGRYVVALAGLTLALAGDEARAKTCADRLEQHNPQRTIVQLNWLPCIRAAVALGREDWKGAVDALESATAVELGTTLPFEAGFMIAPYLRGLALRGAGRPGDASREFMKIIERPGLIRNFVLYPLALKAAGLEGRFQPIWAGADRELRSERSLP
jgi:DNA-binding winged helix-turn-helix (wHTH) protein/tetratricopeptide (TPR) repeat protein